MNKKEFDDIKNSFEWRKKRLKSLKPGQLIYEQELVDPMGFSYFEHEVQSIDLEEMCVITKDNSLKGKITKLYSFSTKEEAFPKYKIKKI